jgi:hypothetical protein
VESRSLNGENLREQLDLGPSLCRIFIQSPQYGIRGCPVSVSFLGRIVVIQGEHATGLASEEFRFTIYIGAEVWCLKGQGFPGLCFGFSDKRVMLCLFLETVEGVLLGIELGGHYDLAIARNAWKCHVLDLLLL